MKLGSFDALVHALKPPLTSCCSSLHRTSQRPFLRSRQLNFWSEQHRDTPVDVFVTEPFDFEAEYGRALVKPLGSIDIEFLRKLADGAN